ncbi:MAG: hypothetical protein HY562_04025 [Ignavibacteriales bacterium]|nr:hypothetical protein [Ignavibacteriales bacterium]
MKNFLLAGALSAGLWYVLRLLREMWGKKLLPGWFTYVGGVLAWLTVISLVGPVWAIVDLLSVMFDRPDMGVAFEIGSLFILISIVGKVLIDHPEILDYARVQPFLLASLKFEHYSRRRDDIFVELDKHIIKQIHKEQTGRELPETKQRKKFIPHTDPQQALREIEQLRAKPLRSVHLESELRQLKAGEVTDITDTFKLNAAKHKTHDFYEFASEIKISPQEKNLSFKVVFPNVNAQTTFDADRIFRLKQGLYDLFQALRSELWLKPYAEYFDTFKVVCHRVDTDTFGLPIEKPFCSVEIALSELIQRDGKFFVATDLDKIAKVSFSL